MASARETLKIEDAVNHGLNILGKADLVLKDKQLEIIRYITLEKRDVTAVLPTGYGKSLVYQLTPLRCGIAEYQNIKSTLRF